jgi:hypothetical protein
MLSAHEDVKALLAAQLPFLDEPCNVNKLIAAVVAARYWRPKQLDRESLQPLSSVNYWMDPAVGCTVRSGGDDPGLPEVTLDQLTRIGEAIRSAVEVKPNWRNFFELPVRFLRLPETSRAISASAPHWPQHIMLSPAAFVTISELREQVVHEFCHQWLYLLEEVCPLEIMPGSRVLTLPSGTKERSLREVVGAAHVGLALADLYEHDGQLDQSNELRAYVQGCVQILDENAAQLTSEATQIIQRMKRWL